MNLHCCSQGNNKASGTSFSHNDLWLCLPLTKEHLITTSQALHLPVEDFTGVPSAADWKHPPARPHKTVPAADADLSISTREFTKLNHSALGQWRWRCVLWCVCEQVQQSGGSVSEDVPLWRHQVVVSWLHTYYRWSYSVCGHQFLYLRNSQENLHRFSYIRCFIFAWL